MTGPKLHKDWLVTEEGFRQLWAYLDRANIDRTVNQIVADFALWVIVEHFPRDPGDFSWGVTGHRLVMQ